MKERLIRFKFKMDSDLSDNPKMAIYSDEGIIKHKIVDQNGQEIESSLEEIEGYYTGNSGRDRVLFSQPVTENHFVTNVDKELALFDLILVVDTSYEPYLEPKMAFTSIRILNRLNVENGEFRYSCRYFLLESDVTSIDKPENFMYCFAIELLRNHCKELNVTPKIAVIIDSDLDKIPSYNTGTRPIFNNYFLPEGFYILYASSDRGEYFQNKLLKLCDNEAKKALEEYRKSLNV